MPLQVTSAPEEEEHRLEIHARPEPSPSERRRSLDAAMPRRRLSGEAPAPLGFDATQWPPAGAEPLEVSDLYERVNDLGLEYGPAFQGLEAAWKLGEETYAEVSLDSAQER